MARIRSIKPEFFTSEQIAECSPNVRLMFVGMWCFSDDYGVSPASVHRIKTQVFPSDNISKEEIRAGIDKLISVGLIQEYEIGGEKYWFVTGWDKHQKPDCKTGLYPRPDGNIGSKIRRTFAEHSPNDHRTTTERSRKEKEKEKEKESISFKQNPTTSSSHSKKKEHIPAAEIEIPAALQTPDFLSAWQEWITYRKDRRSKLTASTMKAQLRDLEGIGHENAAKCIMLSIKNGWLGLFPDRFKAEAEEKYPDAILVNPAGEKAPEGMKWCIYSERWVPIWQSELAY